MSEENYLKFEWDETKSRSNRDKHGVAFEEAITVFFDKFARLSHDPVHSDQEDRFILIGRSNRNRIITTSHVWNDKTHIVRIFSARKATTLERFQYQGFIP